MTLKTSRDCARSNELVSRRLRARLQTASGGDDAAPRGERNARVVVVALVMGRVGGGASTDELGVRCVDVGARDVDAVDRTMERRVDGGATFVFVSFRFVSFRDARERADGEWMFAAAVVWARCRAMHRAREVGCSLWRVARVWWSFLTGV